MLNSGLPTPRHDSVDHGIVGISCLSVLTSSGSYEEDGSFLNGAIEFPPPARPVRVMHYGLGIGNVLWCIIHALIIPST